MPRTGRGARSLGGATGAGDVEQVVQVQHRGRPAERGHDPLRHDAVQPGDVSWCAHESPHTWPPDHRARSAPRRSDPIGSSCTRKPVAAGACDPAFAGDRELELDPFGRQWGTEPQERALGAAWFGRLGHREYA